MPCLMQKRKHKKPFVPKREGGARELPLDFDQIDRLLEAGCLGTEVAAACGCHPETLYDRVAKEYGMPYTDYAYKMRAKGDSCLRSAQHEKAMTKDNTMLIWLGKQRLDQREPDSRSQTSLSIEQLDSIKQLFEQVSALQKPKS